MITSSMSKAERLAGMRAVWRAEQVGLVTLIRDPNHKGRWLVQLGAAQ